MKSAFVTKMLNELMRLHVKLVVPVPNWRVEDGTENGDRSEGAPFAPFYHAPAIENQEAETLWYSQYFWGREHQNYLGVDENHGPYALSILREENQIRAILWLNQGPETIILPTKGKQLSAGDILKKIAPTISKKKLREVKSPALQEELFKLEERTAIRSRFYKFGVLYCKAGQKTEEEMFNNRHGSEEFNRFLSILGEKVALKSFEGFSAGLDTRFNRTGKYSIYTKYCGYEIMFHVSTLLPYTESDPQQVERKRHIGNDIVIILFQDHDAREPWSPLIISSRFPHVYAVVRPVDKRGSAYYVSLSVKDTLKNFGPPLPNPAIFTDPEFFKDFLLAKLINGEREAIRSAPDFRSSDVLYCFLKEIYDKFHKSMDKRSTSYSDLKDVIPLSPSSPSLGELPSSFQGPVIQKPAQQVSVFVVKPIITFPKEVLCCDTLGNTLAIGTSDALYIYDPLKQGTIEDRIFRVKTKTHAKLPYYKQMDVLERLGILLALSLKVGIIMYDLNSLEDDDGPAELRIERTKGATMYALGALNGTLFICCYVKNDLLLIRWEEDRFVPSHAIHLNVEPTCITFWNSNIVVGVDNSFELITPDPDHPTSHTLYTAPTKESKALDVVVLQDELLLCFSNVGVFVNREGQKTRNFDLKWTSVPNSFVYVYPYILAITPVNIEVRTIVNGNLIQTIAPEEGATDLTLLTTSQGIFYGGRIPSIGSSIICQLKLSGPPPPASKKGVARRTTSPSLLPPSSPRNSLSMSSPVIPPPHLSPLPRSQTTPLRVHRASDSEDDSQEQRSRSSASSSHEEKLYIKSPTRSSQPHEPSLSTPYAVASMQEELLTKAATNTMFSPRKVARRKSLQITPQQLSRLTRPLDGKDDDIPLNDEIVSPRRQKLRRRKSEDSIKPASPASDSPQKKKSTKTKKQTSEKAEKRSGSPLQKDGSPLKTKKESSPGRIKQSAMLQDIAGSASSDGSPKRSHLSKP